MAGKRASKVDGASRGRRRVKDKGTSRKRCPRIENASSRKRRSGSEGARHDSRDSIIKYVGGFLFWFCSYLAYSIADGKGPQPATNRIGYHSLLVQSCHLELWTLLKSLFPFPNGFLSRCKFITLTRRRPIIMVE